MALNSPTAKNLHINSSAGGWDSLRTIDERVEMPLGEGSDSDFYDDQGEDDSDSLYVQSFLLTDWERPRIEISEPFWDDDHDFRTDSSEMSDAQVDRHSTQPDRAQAAGSHFQEPDDHREVKGLLSRLQAILRLPSFDFKVFVSSERPSSTAPLAVDEVDLVSVSVSVLT
ncbi:hypothetical protein EST38_g9228 [Candolleomyces aberdarensis]|uniref:Uncharacterized protein n=1 Tax=Candolleomyces aberdarensis TaxID=2316362 RepID=A0A4Q2DCN8_9AGAR|nr:hypothetical protein EST38_g9228 [Candolleomyces aberdarensis]